MVLNFCVCIWFFSTLNFILVTFGVGMCKSSSADSSCSSSFVSFVSIFLFTRYSTRALNAVFARNSNDRSLTMTLENKPEKTLNTVEKAET